jgi:hypothetical protein
MYYFSNVAGIIDRISVTSQMLSHGALQILRAMLQNIIIILPEDVLTIKRKKKIILASFPLSIIESCIF